jgi:hypothetical protein
VAKAITKTRVAIEHGEVGPGADRPQRSQSAGITSGVQDRVSAGSLRAAAVEGLPFGDWVLPGNDDFKNLISGRGALGPSPTYSARHG